MLQFRIQGTPNPLARKYVLSVDLKREGKVSYQQANQCQHVPLASALLHVDGVTQVHFFENVLTITQDGTSDWSYMDETVQNIVSREIEHHNIDFIDYLEQTKPEKKDLPPELIAIEKILDETIRPSLQMDGGDVEPLDLEGNILTIRYMGACGGCPSSMTGTLEAIRHILKAEFSEDIEVVAI
ncbi:MAG: NifU family protein [Oligoflexales bacterium]